MDTKKIAIVGVGNCGSQIAMLAEKKYPDLVDCVYINSSASDLAMVNSDETMKFKIGKTDEVEGSGKNRGRMKEYLLEDVQKILGNEKLQEVISYKRYAFIVTSAAGGTGSGSGPVLMDIMQKLFPDTHFILIGVLPQIGASLMEQGNTLEFLKELYEVLGDQTTYMLYDNESAADLPPTKALEAVNEAVVEDIKVLSGVDNYATPYESIDEADMESILSTPGRLLVVRMTKGLTEKVMEDNNLDEMIIKAIKKSAHCETDRNKRVIRWGVITYFTDAVNRLYRSDLEGLQEFIGTPIERFNHNAINAGNENLNFMHLIAAGLSPINDRVTRITNRIEELKNALAADESSKYILSGDSASYEALSERRREERHKAINEDIDPEAIFKKFMQ